MYTSQAFILYRPNPLTDNFPVSLLVYLLGMLFTTNFILIFIITILLLAADFYYLKNIAGRRLVGLRWWNEVNAQSGESHWVFESAPQPNEPGGKIVNPTDKRFFWLALYAQPALWVVLAIVALLRTKFVWLTLVGEYIRLCWVWDEADWMQLLRSFSPSRIRLHSRDATSLARLVDWWKEGFTPALWHGTLVERLCQGSSRAADKFHRSSCEALGAGNIISICMVLVSLSELSHNCLKAFLAVLSQEQSSKSITTIHFLRVPSCQRLAINNYPLVPRLRKIRITLSLPQRLDGVRVMRELRK